MLSVCIYYLCYNNSIKKHTSKEPLNSVKCVYLLLTLQ